MSGYRIDIVQPDYYAHWPALQEVADGLRGALVELEAWAEHGRPIVLGAHLDNRFIVRDAIIFQTEVVGSAWFTPAYRALLAAHEVWDYSAENVIKLARQSIQVKHCAIGYHECLTRIPGMESRGLASLRDESERTGTGPSQLHVQDIDVLFYGSLTQRRIPIWESICQTGLNCVHLFGVYGEARDAYIARSKIVLNLHAYPMSPREDVRLSYLWANRVFVLSEGASGPFEYTAEQLPESCREWVRRDADRRFFAGAIHDSFKLQRQADYLRPLIAAEKAAA